MRLAAATSSRPWIGPLLTPEHRCRSRSIWHGIHLKGPRGVAYQRGVKLDLTHPRKPTENGHLKSFNGRLRDVCLNVTQLISIEDARSQIERWRIDYNVARPHNSWATRLPRSLPSEARKPGPQEQATSKRRLFANETKARTGGPPTLTCAGSGATSPGPRL